jgi:branched-chain amino acid transport system substrate-binding protein
MKNKKLPPTAHNSNTWRNTVKTLTLLRMKLGIAAFSVLLAGSHAGAAETVKIGIGLSLTGPLAFLSQQYLQGMKAAVAVVNKEGGVGGGRMLELVPRDHKGVPSEAVAVTKRMIEEDKVAIVDIDLPSTVAIAAESVTKESKVPQIAGFTFAPAAVEQGNAYFFRACTTSDLIGDALAKSIVAERNNKTIAMLAPNDDYGRSTIKSLSAAIERLGGPKVVYADYYERTQNDFSAVLLKMKSLNPDSLFIDVRYPASLTVLKQMVEIGLKKPLFSSVNFYNAKLAAQAGPLLEGAQMSVAWAPVFKDPASVKFAKAYEAMFKKVPDDSASLGWTATMVAAEALKAAGPHANAEKLRKALSNVHFNGPQGTVKFDAKGDASVAAHVLRFKDGQYHLVR